MAYAVGRVHIEAVRASLERAGPEPASGSDRAALLRAAMIGSTAAVRVFLDRGLPVDTTDQNNRTPLMEAVFGGHLDTIQELLDRGANVNAQDSDGWTPLMEGAAKGHVDVVRTLLAHGADPRLRNKNGWTVLKTAARSNIELSRLLKNAGAE